MVTIFFSGTGNTEYIAKRFSNRMNSDCFSIEDDVDFVQILTNNESICVCYPIYDSRIPEIFRKFILGNKKLFKNKKLIILATQMFFSGDGARAFTDLFPKNYLNVQYAEHFNMPNNVCNIPILWRFWLKNGKQNTKKLRKANKKLSKVCGNIKQEIVVRRGFNPFSRMLGLIQGASALRIENKGKGSVKTDSDCTACGLCVKICPMKNLQLVNRKIKHNNNCTLCYRCVNACPRKSITVLISKKPKEQYHGVKN